MLSPSLRDDLHIALRRVVRAKGASLLIVFLLSLAIAMGACVFATAYGMLWKSLPFPMHRELVQLTGHSNKMGIDLGWSVPYFDAVARHSRQLEGVSAYRRKELAQTDDAGRYTSTVESVTAEPRLFAVLGATPAKGRLLASDDARPGADPVALISDAFWRDSFNGTGDILERKLYLAGRAYRIVGVLPPSFVFPDRAVQVWLPLGFTPAETAMENAGSFGDLRAIARLRPGATAASADAEMSSLVKADETLSWISGQIGLRLQAKPLRALWLDGRENSLKLMLVAVTLAFAVTVANAYNLFLLGLLKRRQELALLESVGATAFRRSTQIALEAGALTIAATLLAAAATPLGVALLRHFDVLPNGMPQHIGLDGATVLALLAMCGAATAALASCGVVFNRQNVFEVLRQTGNGQTASSRVHLLRQGLVMAQIAITFVLLFATALLVRSSNRLLEQDLGFERSGRVVGRLQPAIEHGDADADLLREQMAAWRNSVASTPGVEAVAFSSSVPFSENVTLEALSGTAAGITAEDSSHKAYVAHVSPDYPGALGLRLRQGRAFLSAEAEGEAAVALIDTVLADRYFAGVDPIGRSIGVTGGSEGAARTVTVVGVVGRIRQRTLAEEDEYPSIYLPSAVPYALPGVPLSSVEFVVKARRSDNVADQLEQQLKRNAPSLRMAGLVTLEQRIDDTIADLLRLNTMLKILSAVTMLLSTVGLYALLAHSVAMRTREYGIRQALGATARHLLQSVLIQGAKLVAISVACAVPVALLVGSLLKARLHEPALVDVRALAGVGALLILVGLLANAVPAYRASRVNPMEALRTE